MAGALLEKESYPVNTDDRMLIEFSFAKSFLLKKPDVADTLREFSWKNGFGKPSIKDGQLDWFLVNENFIMMNALFQMLERNYYLPADVQQRVEALLAFNNDNAVQADHVLASWQNQKRKPAYPVEMAMLAEAMAAKGRREALEIADRLKSFFPVDANAIKARYYWVSQDHKKALASLKESFELWRSYPWIFKQVMGRALILSMKMAAQKPEMAKQVFQLVSQPFSVHALESLRKNMMMEVASQADVQTAVSALSQLEPYIVPWNKALLEYRAEIYKQSSNTLYAKAQEDLETFLSFACDTEQKTITKQALP